MTQNLEDTLGCSVVAIISMKLGYDSESYSYWIN